MYANHKARPHMLKKSRHAIRPEGNSFFFSTQTLHSTWGMCVLYFHGVFKGEVLKKKADKKLDCFRLYFISLLDLVFSITAFSLLI